MGVEPIPLAGHDFKSCAYTSSATRSFFCVNASFYHTFFKQSVLPPLLFYRTKEAEIRAKAHRVTLCASLHIFTLCWRGDSVTNILLAVARKISRPQLIHFLCSKNMILFFSSPSQAKQLACSPAQFKNPPTFRGIFKLCWRGDSNSQALRH